MREQPQGWRMSTPETLIWLALVFGLALAAVAVG